MRRELATSQLGIRFKNNTAHHDILILCLWCVRSSTSFLTTSNATLGNDMRFQLGTSLPRHGQYIRYPPCGFISSQKRETNGVDASHILIYGYDQKAGFGEILVIILKLMTFVDNKSVTLSYIVIVLMTFPMSGPARWYTNLYLSMYTRYWRCTTRM